MMVADHDDNHSDIAWGMSARSLKQFESVDGMGPSLKACVHEFGYTIVHAMLEAGVTKPNVIRNLVREVWLGARQPGEKLVAAAPSAAMSDAWSAASAKKQSAF